MSVVAKLTGEQFDAMVECGAFEASLIGNKKVELINGELRFMGPAGPIHDDHIDYLNRWSTNCTTELDATIRVQCGFVCDDNRPEPDVLWLKPKRYGRSRPTTADVLLLIEISDSSLKIDLSVKADIYARSGVAEYWVVDIANTRLHVMNQSDGKNFCSTRIITAPEMPAPRCLPEAKLDLAQLFEVI